MSWLGQSSCLNWASYDRLDTATFVAEQSILETAREREAKNPATRLKSSLIRLDSPAHIQSANHALGLALWNIRSLGELEEVANAVQMASVWRIRPIQVVLLERSLESATGILLEAGAQIVVRELLFLRQAIRQAVANAFCVQQASHPLLADLPLLLKRFD